MNKTLATLTLVGAGLLFGGASTTVAAHAAAKTSINVVLKPTNDGGFTDYVYQTVTPGTAHYHQYLTPSGVASQFGQSTSTVKQFQKYFKRYKLTTKVFPGNLVLRVTGTRANLVKAFKAKLTKTKVNTHTTTKLPATLSKKTVAVIGLYAKKSDAKAKKAKHAIYPKYNDKPNLKLNTSDFANKYGAAKFAKQYHLDQLTQNGQTGQGQRIGIITLAADMNVKDAQTYWRMVGAPASANRITKYYTDDQKAAVADYNQSMGFNDGQVEASLDVEQAGETAPGAKIDVYTAISENETEKMDQLYYNAFANAISANRDKQLSTSFSSDMEDAKLFSRGASETVQQLNQAFNVIFRQAAAQGISVFGASGDTSIWAEPASHENHQFSSSPYITVDGGTTLPYQYNIRGKDINQPTETAWGDMITMSKKDIAGGHFAAGGGGFSALNATPPYQLGVPGVNTFRAISLLKYQKGKYIVQKNPQVIAGTKTGRNLPDVAGNADKTTGYAVYASGTQVMPIGKHILTNPIKFWQVSGGTSFTTPQMAGANAVMNSGLSQPVGFWNPQIYKFAQQADTPFTVLDSTTSTNLYYTGQPGKLYNQASGLGTVNFDKLMTLFKQ